MLSAIGVLMIRGFVLCVGFVPLSWVRGGARLLADACFAIGLKRETMLKNLDYIYGDERSAEEKRHIARQANRNAFYMGAEMLRASNRRCTSEAASHVRFDDLALMEEIDAGEKAGLFIVAHSGNIDMPAVWWTQHLKMPAAVVMKPLESRRFNDLLVRTRKVYGLRVISTKAEDAVDQINDVMRRGEALCLLPDQNARKRGVVVEFLGRPASTYKGPAATYLENRERCRLVVCVPTRVGDTADIYVRSYEISDFEPTGDRAADIARLTQRITTAMGRFVRESPESYLWHHRRWGKAPWGAPEPALTIPVAEATTPTT